LYSLPSHRLLVRAHLITSRWPSSAEREQMSGAEQMRFPLAAI
jgi:hypothetical protein